MGRFFVFWLTVSALCGVFVYFMDMKQKLETTKVVWRVAICAAIGLVVTILALGVNLIQGL